MNVGFEVVVNGEELTGTANWANILNLYETDKQICSIGCCLM
jgi:hypothetical protein